ncbi:MAG TPA: CBS domain-containing protein [Polyangiaceae bacterium]
MKCFELMKTQVECCDMSDSVVLVAETMRQRNIGFLPVCDGGGRVVGTLTDRDLVLRVLAERRDPGGVVAGDVMTSDVVSCAPEDELTVAELLMSQHKKSRIVCVDGRKRPIGVISLSDVARVETQAKSAAILRSVAQREAL